MSPYTRTKRRGEDIFFVKDLGGIDSTNNDVIITVLEDRARMQRLPHPEVTLYKQMSGSKRFTAVVNIINFIPSRDNHTNVLRIIHVTTGTLKFVGKPTPLIAILNQKINAAIETNVIVKTTPMVQP